MGKQLERSENKEKRQREKVTKAARKKEMKEEMNVKSEIKLTESKIQINK